MSIEANLLERIEQESPTLSKASKQIGQFALERSADFLVMTTRQISEAIAVSEPTLVRFCRKFGYKGIADFRLALAVAAAAESNPAYYAPEPSIHEKLGEHIEAKRSIALEAYALLADDRTILLDSGSTVQCFAQELVHAKPLTILTTGLFSLLDLKDSTQHSLLLAGGRLRPDAMSVSGRLTEGALSEMTFDTAYVGADSVDAASGLSTYSEDEAHLTRAMIRASRRTVLLADASKFRSPMLHKICSLDDIDVVVTDASIPRETQRAIRDAGVELLIAPMRTMKNATGKTNV